MKHLLLLTMAAGAMWAQPLSKTALERWREELARRGTTALVVVHQDHIVYEWYAEGWNSDRPHYTASTAKSLVGGLSLIVAMQDGRIRPESAAHDFITPWTVDPRRNRIRIVHLATHTSGIEDAEQDGLPHDQLPDWKGAFWKRTPDPFTIAIRDAPVMEPPGTRYRYSNTGMAALAYAVTASLAGQRQRDLLSLLRERVYQPIGLKPEEWSIGYGRAYELDGLSLYANWGGGNFTARAMARIGQLIAHQGRWDGKQVLSPEWLRRSTSYAGMPKPDRRLGPRDPASGLGFYTNEDGVWPAAPRDAVAASGAGNQFLLVVPSMQLVAVRQGESLSQRQRPGEHYRSTYDYVIEPLMAALETPAPYPPSSTIRSVDFAPAATIRRAAIDSDNWPITWGDDGDLYTSYGDGRGFEPFVDRKLSLGFARITGGPDDFSATNIRSESGERTGDGEAGLKSSGMLMVEGVLYMWVRNADSAQLAWSEDRGRTWQWGFKFDVSFGSPAFLNFGKNYAGARDEFVYAYSQDGSSAYEQSDGIVLARVHRSRIRDRAAYEFLSSREGAPPAWSRNVSERTRVFTYARRCERVDAVYNAGLRRYLLAVSYGHHGGWGLYESAQPWGPWKTAFHTNDWGLGPTHGYRIPSKWISGDGRTMTLVFSGRNGPGLHFDAFSTRAMYLR